MGRRPLAALNIMGMPDDLVPAKTIATILRGGLEKAREVGCVIVGGHTIRNPEPIYGLAVTGLVSPRLMMTNARAKPGDYLVLTKPLGTGIITTGIKRGLTSRALAKMAIRLMSTVNAIGAELAEKRLVRAATDVTGFGLLGHLASMCRASGVSAEVNASHVPTIADEVFDLITRDSVPGGTEQNRKTANIVTDWGKTKMEKQLLLTDAQTSGGLLLAVTPRKLNAVLRLLREHRTPAHAVIGQIFPRRKRLIRVISS